MHFTIVSFVDKLVIKTSHRIYFIFLHRPMWCLDIRHVFFDLRVINYKYKNWNFTFRHTSGYEAQITHEVLQLT